MKLNKFMDIQVQKLKQTSNFDGNKKYLAGCLFFFLFVCFKLPQLKCEYREIIMKAEPNLETSAGIQLKKKW